MTYGTVGKQRPARQPKKRRQFSQLHVIFADFLVAAVFAANVWLVYIGRAAISDIAIAIITTYGAFATGGYFALAGVRDTSRDKMRIALHESEEEECGGTQ